MAKYFALPLLLITSFMVGCSEPPATEEEAKQGMDTLELMTQVLIPVQEMRPQQKKTQRPDVAAPHCRQLLFAG